VIAEAGSVITVPGTGGGADGSNSRFNPTEAKPTADNTKLVKLAYVDISTGEISGASSLVTPLAPNTDFTVNDASDGSGFDYTETGRVQFSPAATTGRVQFSPAATGTGVEVTMQNSANGPLQVTMLKVRGVGTVIYDPVSMAVEDTTSIAAYGRQSQAFKFVLTPNNAVLFAEAFAGYMLARLKDPTYRDSQIVFNGQTTVNGVNIYSLDIGSIITVTEYQTGVTAQRLLITGVNARLDVKGNSLVQFAVRAIDEINYGLWDDATYGKWDSAAWAL